MYLGFTGQESHFIRVLVQKYQKILVVISTKGLGRWVYQKQRQFVLCHIELFLMCDELFYVTLFFYLLFLTQFILTYFN